MSDEQSQQKMTDREMLLVAYGAMKSAALNQPLIRMIENHLFPEENIASAKCAPSIDLANFRG